MSLFQQIDIHSHFFPKITQAQAQSFKSSKAPWLQINDDGQTGFIMLGDEKFRPVHRPLWDTDARVQDLDRLGIDIQIACATPVMFAYAEAPQIAADWCKRMNDAALDMVAPAQARVKVMAQVPMQSLDHACLEVSRAKRNGHIGVQIGNHLGPKNLDDALFVDFFKHCAQEQMPVFVHPWDMLGGDRMKQWMLPWLVGMPAETHLGILSMMLSGAFEQIPTTLKLCFAHGGGAFAFLLGRADNAWHERDIVRANSPHPPSHYVNRFYTDGAVFDSRSLRLLTDVMGSERVMLGSDYPFPLGEAQIGGLIRNAEEFDTQERQQLLGGNAKIFFSL